MKQRVIGIVLATVAVYLWGFLYWGVSPVPYTAWKQTNGDEAAQQALREHFPESGTYYVPGRHHDEETMNRLFEAGPVGFVHINLARRPAVDPSIMLTGFLFTAVVVSLISILMAKSAPAFPSYMDKVKFAALTGLTAVVMIEFGDAVWWQTPWHWKVFQAFYNFAAWTTAALVLAKFSGRVMRAEAAAE